jgi:hypothetical protein
MQGSTAQIFVQLTCLTNRQCHFFQDADVQNDNCMLCVADGQTYKTHPEANNYGMSRWNFKHSVSLENSLHGISSVVFKLCIFSHWR